MADTNIIIQPSALAEELQTPPEPGLSQNYPNPFNATTRIEYSLTKASLVTLDIYDLAGRHIAQLVKGNQNAGRYSTTFRAYELASGVYISRLVIITSKQNIVKTRKLLLLK